MDLPDDLNPEFMLQTTRTELLVRIVQGDLDPVALARSELENRGLDTRGNWTGFPCGT